MSYSSDENIRIDINTENTENTENEFPNIINDLAIVIPNVYHDEPFIRKIFRELSIGEIRMIDFMASDEYQRNAYIYMESWDQNRAVEHLHERIMKPRGFGKIVYDDPNFWALIPNYNDDHVCTLYDHVIKLNERLNGITDLLNGLDEKFSKIDMLESKINEKHNAIKNQNGSCCGAVSDAWQPSEAQKMLKRKRKQPMRDSYNLRPRLN